MTQKYGGKAFYAAFIAVQQLGMNIHV
jgi:hypothetical protein